MSNYPYQPVVVIPKIKLAAFNRYMADAGFGPDYARREVFSEASSPNAPATHYVVECPCDNKQMAAVEKAVAANPGVRITRNNRTPSGSPKRLVAVLASQGLKPKPRGRE